MSALNAVMLAEVVMLKVAAHTSQSNRLLRIKEDVMNKKMAQLGEKTNLTKEDVKKLTKVSILGLLALVLSVFTVGWSDSNAVEVKPQPENDKAMPLRCGLKPEHGPCKANFDKYYFDAKTNKCKSFMYGGCDGVVPFETQEACEKSCIKQQTESPAYPVSKYAAVGIGDFK